jgi:hypothetical protein
VETSNGNESIWGDSFARNRVKGDSLRFRNGMHFGHQLGLSSSSCLCRQQHGHLSSTRLGQLMLSLEP